MANNEYRLVVEDFEQLVGILSTFEATLEQSCCQTTIGLTETTMFNKWATGKSDLFTSTIHLEQGDGVPETMSIFIPDVKKFIVVLKNIGKYYDVADTSIWTDGKVKLFVCAQGSNIRISSPKYNIKFQLSTNAILESQRANIEKVLVPSKYGNVVHQVANREDLQANFLLTANVNSNKFSEIGDLLATLSETAESSIKIQIPEQAKIEEDVNSNPLNNTLYATISDNQKLVKSNIGNKVSVEFGKITYAAENYRDVCCTTSTTSNFVFLMNQSLLQTLSSVCKTFTSASKAKDIEVVISKPNLIHLNLTTTGEKSRSEVYVTIIGMKAASLL